jgi:hypothetical protein
MTEAYGRPLMLQGSMAVLLDRAPLGQSGTAAYSEDWLQDLLYRYPQALPVGEIDDAYAGLVPACRELNTAAGPLDVFYVTPSGRIAVAEAKLWRNPEARRKVVAQILDYAKELTRWNYETLDAAVRQARRTEGETTPTSLFEVVRATAPATDERSFIDAVSRNLRNGEFLLLIVGDGIREGVGSITEFLERHGMLHFTFGLVEMAIYRLPGGGELVQPRMLAQSTIIRRVVVQVQGGTTTIEESTPEEAAAEGSPSVTPELQETRRLFLEFWGEFLETLKLDDQSQPIRPPSRTTNQFFDMPTGSEGWVSAYVAQSSQCIGVYLTFGRGAIANRIYGALVADRENIEKALGCPVSWESDGSKHWVACKQVYHGVLLKEHRAEVKAWLADRANRFINVFRPRIAALLQEA